MGAMHLPCFFVGICWCLENRMPFEPVRSGEQKRPETVRCVSSHLSLLWDFTWIVHPLYPWQNTYVGTLRHSAFQKGTSPPGLRSWTKCGRGEEVLLGNGRCLHHCWGRSWSGTRCPESHGTECFCPRPETNRWGWEGCLPFHKGMIQYGYDPNNWQRPVPSCCFFGTLVWIVMINFRQMWEIMPHCYGFFSAKKKPFLSNTWADENRGWIFWCRKSPVASRRCQRWKVWLPRKSLTSRLCHPGIRPPWFERGFSKGWTIACFCLVFWLEVGGKNQLILSPPEK